MAIAAPGGPEVLRPLDLERPAPQAGEALVKLAASGVNYVDVYYRDGTYPAPHLPLVLGCEGAGTVEIAGAGVANVKPGDRVAYAMPLGSYAEFAAVPAWRLVRVPEGISLRDAAAIMLQGMTAHYLVNSTFPLKAGDVALVHAGAGGLGTLVTQLAKAKGATVVTTVSTEAKAELSRSLGADHAVLYGERNFAQEIRRITGGRGADVVYDSVGRTTFEGSLDSLRPRGMLVLLGASSGNVPPFDLQQLNAKGSLFVTRPSLAHYTRDESEIGWRASELFAAIAAGSLRVLVEREYPLADAARAHADLESRATTGKLVLLP
jgi:NADPH2:quinone reductase